MDDPLAAMAADDEFRGAANWWMRLRATPANSHTLTDFHDWLNEHPTHRESFARVETLWRTVQASLARTEMTGCEPQATVRVTEG